MMCELETVINNNNIAIGVGVVQLEDGRTGGTMDLTGKSLNSYSRQNAGSINTIFIRKFHKRLWGLTIDN